MIAIIYISLLLFTSLILYRSGKLCIAHFSRYYYYALLGIIIFSLNVGLRWGRGLDYNYYYVMYNDVIKGFESTWEPLFQLLIKVFGFFDISWQGFVLFMSFVLITSIYVFLKNCPKILPIGLALFPIFATPAENLMRWYLGFSFILCGLGFLVNKKKHNLLSFIIFSFIGLNIHSGLFAFPIICFCIWKYNRVLLNSWISISLFFLVTFLFETNVMLNLVNVINNLSLGEHFARYQSNLDYWLTGGFAGGSRSSFVGIGSALFYIMIIIFGYKISEKENHIYRFIFNVYIIGFVTHPACRQIELLDRYNQLFFIFQFIVLSYIIYYMVNRRINIKVTHKILVWLIILNFIRPIIMNPFVGNPNHYLYIWDSNGRNTLDVYKEYIQYMQN